MKIHVTVDQAGKVIATGPAPAPKDDDTPRFVRSGPAQAREGFRTFEIEATSDVRIREDEDVSKHHERLGKLIRSNPDLRPLPDDT